MNVSSWLQQAKQKIDFLDAELLLLPIFNQKDRSFLVAHGDLELPEKILEILDSAVTLRASGMPLAYIVNRKEFYGRDFKLNRNVLIPRPESEAIIDLAKSLEPQPQTILDVGTGSGCLAISLALELPAARLTATDLSKEALLVAATNAVELGARVDFVRSDLLDKVEGEFDLIVANLPYVSVDWPWLGAELAYEPSVALYAGDQGLELIKKLLNQVAEKYHVTPVKPVEKCIKKLYKRIILEADPCQHSALCEYAERRGFSLVARQGFACELAY